MARLTDVFRQAAASRIVTNAHRINAGDRAADDAGRARRGDFYLVDAADARARRASGCWRWCASASRDASASIATRDMQVLCPMNRGAAGAKALNLALQAALNPHGAPRLERFGSDVRAGRQGDADRERLRQGGLQRRRRPRRVDRPRGAARWSSTSTAGEIAYDAAELDRLVLAYATTIHKAQGSEYPAVVMPLTTQHYPMLQRKLIYTAHHPRQPARRRGRTEEGARRSRSGRPPRGAAGRSSRSGCARRAVTRARRQHDPAYDERRDRPISRAHRWAARHARQAVRRATLAKL